MNFELEAYEGELRELREYKRKNPALKIKLDPNPKNLYEQRLAFYRRNFEELENWCLLHKQLSMENPEIPIFKKYTDGGYYNRSYTEYFTLDVNTAQKISLKTEFGGYS